MISFFTDTMASSIVIDLTQSNVDYYEEMEIDDEGFGGSPDTIIQTSNENGTYYDHDYGVPTYIFPTGIDTSIDNQIPQNYVPQNGVPQDGVPQDGLPQDGVPQISVPSNEPIPASFVTWLDLFESSNSNRVPFEDEVPAENQNVTNDPVTYERLDAKILPGVKMHAYGK